MFFFCALDCEVDPKPEGFHTDCVIKGSNVTCGTTPIPQVKLCIARKVAAGNKCIEKGIPGSRCFNEFGDTLTPGDVAQCTEADNLFLAKLSTTPSTQDSTTRTSSSTPSTTASSKNANISASGSSSTPASVADTQSVPTLSDPSATTSPISSTPQNQQKSRMSDGAVAGIAIGTAILGAAIAGLIFLFLLQKYRKRNRQVGSGDYPRSNGDAASEGKSPVVIGNTAVAAVDSFLPQPAEDDAISGEMSRLRDNIKNHVQSYYITSAVNPNSVDQAKLLDLSAATGLSTAKLQDMLLNPLSRTSAIRLYLAWVILSRCGTQKATGPSFLPCEIAAFAALLSDSRSNANLVLSTKWKAISGELLQSRYGRQQNFNSASLGDSVAQAMAAADAVLFPFINTSLEASSDKRLRNLEVIIKRSAQFAFLLFSQPSIFVFEWAAQKGGAVVFPGLLQIVDEDGNVTQPPKSFSPPEFGGA